MLDVAIIGGGPAGLTAGLYATRGGAKDVVLFEKGMVGGQIVSSSELENYPGIAQVMSGMDFMQPWSEQCFRFGLKHEMAEVLRIERTDCGNFKIILSDERVFDARTVIVATGGHPRKAGIQGELEFYGRGVSTCATCDGFFYKDREVAVIGGGNTALEETLYLAKICKKVYLIHRREDFRATPSTVEKVRENPKITLMTSRLIEEIEGDSSGVNGVRIKHKESGEVERIPVMGVFVFVGYEVNRQILRQSDGSFLCEISEDGAVIVDLEMKTNVPGLFAAGDLRIHAPKQVVCAAGDGANAALSALTYLEHSKEL
ncbi:MAG: thioredoxin-disulfide reductase [Wolinella sp.]